MFNADKYYNKYPTILFIGALCAFISVNTPCHANKKVSLASISYVNDAGNIKTGTITPTVLPIGTQENTIAAGNDTRFDTLPIGRPETTNTPNDRVLVWIE